ncbi:kinase-like domain-containing protein [Mucidula mucida]|nr:kinase-like domain-containing protein [Mucidula mucida]
MFAPSPNVHSNNPSSTHYVALPTARPPQHSTQPTKEPINVVGIPSVHIEHNKLVVGSSQSSSTRSYTPLKVLGDGSFGTVWLCDWHGTLPPNTPLSSMQCGAGARPEWAGKRLVAVKRMKKRWEGGWDECQKLKELEVLAACHTVSPKYHSLSMEGNLYHLIKARKGRALAGGLVSSIFRQIVSGLDHIHSSGYFHRDMKPENVLVTTTGLFDYNTLSPLAPPNAPPEKDVVAIIKLADFGLARETKSKPPYTEYVSTRWYRAPEVLLLSRDYSNPVDMWALGTIMAELVNLRPLFPGADQVDQVTKICEILGDPSDEYPSEQPFQPLGGGPWPRGIKMAKDVGFKFPKMRPQPFFSLFERTVPPSLIHCIRDLLKYDPDARLTSRQCLHHQYLLETTPRNNIPLPQQYSAVDTTPPRNGLTPNGHHSSSRSPAPHASPSHLHPSVPAPSASHRVPLYAPQPISGSTSTIDVHMYHSPSPHSSGLIQEEARSHVGSYSSSPSAEKDYPMDVTPSEDYLPHGQPMDVSGSSSVQTYQTRPPEPVIIVDQPENTAQPKSNKLSLGFGKKHTKWNIFGGDKSNGLPPVQEVPASNSQTSLKRTQSASSDGPLRESSPSRDARMVDIKKVNKKEAERLQREAEKQRRALAEKMHREQARAVMQKRNQIVQKLSTTKDDLDWIGGSEQRLDFAERGKQAATGPIRQGAHGGGVSPGGTTTVNAAAGRFVQAAAEQPVPSTSMWREESNGSGSWRAERVIKSRRSEREHSVEVPRQSDGGRMSSMSFSTVDSDPGPSRIRNRPSAFGLNRMQSSSSLRTSFDDFSPSGRSSNSFSIDSGITSARSSNSFSLDGQLAHDFRMRATVNSGTPPLAIHSISPSLSPSLPPSPAWMQVPHGEQRGQAPPLINLPRSHQGKPYSAFDISAQLHGHPPSPDKSDINPIFQVVSYKWDEGGLEPDYIIPGDPDQPPILPPPHPPPPPDMDDRISSSSPTSLPPFSELDAVAGAGYEYPPLSPMAFTEPDE